MSAIEMLLFSFQLFIEGKNDPSLVCPRLATFLVYQYLIPPHNSLSSAMREGGGGRKRSWGKKRENAEKMQKLLYAGCSDA